MISHHPVRVTAHSINTYNRLTDVCRSVFFFPRISVGSVVAMCSMPRMKYIHLMISYSLSPVVGRTGTNARAPARNALIITKLSAAHVCRCCRHFCRHSNFHTHQLLRQLSWQQIEHRAIDCQKNSPKTQCSRVKTMMTSIAAARLFKNLQSSDESEEFVTASIHGITYILFQSRVWSTDSSSYYVIRKHLNILEWEPQQHQLDLCVSSSNLRCAVRDEINK